MPKHLSWLVLFSACLYACGNEAGEPALLEPGEELPGGAATNTRLFGVNSFNQPAPVLSSDEDDAFFTGNSFFSKSWVTAPSSTSARDGVGPTFNARGLSQLGR